MVSQNLKTNWHCSFQSKLQTYKNLRNLGKISRQKLKVHHRSKRITSKSSRLTKSQRVAPHSFSLEHTSKRVDRRLHDAWMPWQEQKQSGNLFHQRICFARELLIQQSSPNWRSSEKLRLKILAKFQNKRGWKKRGWVEGLIWIYENSFFFFFFAVENQLPSLKIKSHDQCSNE